MSTKLDHILGLAILILWAAVTAYRHWDFWGVDMSALYWAGHFFALGEFDQIYVSTSDFFWKDPPGKWLELAQLYQAPKNAVAPYIYPPIVAAAVAPFTQMLSPQGFFNMFQILNAAAITWAVWASWRMWGPTRIKFTVWVLVSIVLLQLSMPATLALSLNQPQIIVGAITLAAFTALARNHQISAGAWLALAAAIKLGPASLAILFLMQRSWTALASFAIVGAALAGLSIALAGLDMHWLLLEKVGDVNGKVLISRINYSIEPILFQLSQMIQGTADFWPFDYIFFEQPAWIGWVTKLLLLISLVGIYVITNHHPEPQKLWLRVILTASTLMIFSPLAWAHYLLLPLLMLPALFAILPQRTAIISLVLLIVVFSDFTWQALVDSPMSLWSPLLVGFFGLVIALKALGIWAWRYK